MTFTNGVRQFISFRFPSRYSLKVRTRSWSSWRIASGEFDCWIAVAKGVSERSVPVVLVYSAKAASIIHWKLEVEDVVCPVDDMRTMDVFTFLRSESEGMRE